MEKNYCMGGFRWASHIAVDVGDSWPGLSGADGKCINLHAAMLRNARPVITGGVRGMPGYSLEYPRFERKK